MMIGVLALQGAFREHRLMLESIDLQVSEVRLPKDLVGLKGLIIPGGESTTMAKLLALYELNEPICEFAASGKGLWGTCAGAIAIASEIVGFPKQPKLNLMDISVERNAYGRQVSSFEIDTTIKGFEAPFRTVFIRAPRIVRVGASVEVLASYKQDPILVRQKNLMASVFHPELTADARIHQYFATDVCR